MSDGDLMFSRNGSPILFSRQPYRPCRIYLEHDGIKHPTFSGPVANIYVQTDFSAVLPARRRMVVPTGLIMEFSAGFGGQVFPLPVSAHQHGLVVLQHVVKPNGPLNLIVFNMGNQDVIIEGGARIAQFTVSKMIDLDYIEIVAHPPDF